MEDDIMENDLKQFFDIFSKREVALNEDALIGKCSNWKMI